MTGKNIDRPLTGRLKVLPSAPPIRICANPIRICADPIRICANPHHFRSKGMPHEGKSMATKRECSWRKSWPTESCTPLK